MTFFFRKMRQCNYLENSLPLITVLFNLTRPSKLAFELFVYMRSNKIDDCVLATANTGWLRLLETFINFSVIETVKYHLRIGCQKLLWTAKQNHLITGTFL